MTVAFVVSEQPARRAVAPLNKVARASPRRLIGATVGLAGAGAHIEQPPLLHVPQPSVDEPRATNEFSIVTPLQIRRAYYKITHSRDSSVGSDDFFFWPCRKALRSFP
jgi:hypothetical protein